MATQRQGTDTIIIDGEKGRQTEEGGPDLEPI